MTISYAHLPKFESNGPKVIYTTRDPIDGDNAPELYKRNDIWIYLIKDYPHQIYWFDGKEWIIP